MSPRTGSTLSRTTSVGAPPEEVWALVSDLPGMGRFSPENRGGSWAGGRSGPAVGAVFRGRNGRGLRRWATRSVVVECEPPRAFAFEVSALGLPVAVWRYEVEPEAGGCRLTESWSDRRGALLRKGAALVTGVGDRESFNERSIEVTLRRVKEAAEGQTGHSA